MRTLLTLCLFILSVCHALAQAPDYQLSAPVDVSETGSNSLLQMCNGNTLLFHFEAKKSILVKVFDKNHKEIATQKHPCEILDINRLYEEQCAGIYEINGEAVLFFRQAYLNRATLIRIRINPENGKMIKEEIVARAGAHEGIAFCVMKESGKDEYAVLEFKEQGKYEDGKYVDNKMSLNIYSNKHEIIRHASLVIPWNEFAESVQIKGLRIENGTFYCVSELWAHDNDRKRNNCWICSQLKTNDSVFTNRYIQINNDEQTGTCFLSYNSFSETENVLLLTSKRIFNITENNFYTTEHPSRFYFCPFSTDSFGLIGINGVQSAKLLNALYSKTPRDSVHHVMPMPAGMYTNKNGATFLIYEEEAIIRGQNRRDYLKSFLGNIGISILNDDGTEIAATAIPQSQYITIDHDDVQSYKQAGGFYFLPAKNSCYFIANINRNNFDKQVGDSLITLSDMHQSNVICYTMDKSRQIHRSWLFGDTENDETKYALLSSNSYNDRTNTYAVLMRHLKGDVKETCIAWCTLQP